MTNLNHIVAAVKTTNHRIDEALARNAVEAGRASWRPELPAYSYEIVMPEEPPYDDGLIDPTTYEPSAEDWADYGEWAEEVDDRLWNERIESEAMFDFPAWIAAQASMIRLQGTDAAGWLADQVEQLAAAAKALDAIGPESYEDRKAAMEDAAKQWDQ